MIALASNQKLKIIGGKGGRKGQEPGKSRKGCDKPN